MMEFEDAVKEFNQTSIDETIKICKDAYEVLVREPTLLNLSCNRTLVVGDIHGDLESCLNALRLAKDSGCSKIVFLGDYVDRGLYQTGVMNLLLNEKTQNPDRVILLRGNHETPSMNISYGFIELLVRKFGNNYEMAYNAYLQVFSEMPVAAVVNSNIILVHGGLARGIKKLDDFTNAGKGGVEPDDPRIFETIWNDPSEYAEEFSQNPRGSGTYYFGKKALERFLIENNLKMMIRGHEPEPSGYRVLFNGMLVTVFSCRFYGIKPAALRIEVEEYSFESLE